MADWTDTGTFEVDAKSLEYRCFGPAPSDAPTIVLLHEGLGCAAQWKNFPQELATATGFGVFAYSRSGYGHSDPAELPRPIDYMTQEATKVLPVVLDKIGFRRGILMGHSDGATIAAIYAGFVSDPRVRGTILMAPHFFTEDLGLKSIAAAKIAYETTDMRERMSKYHLNPDHTFRGWNDAWLDPKFKAWDVSEVIDHFRIPTLAIQGRQDQYGTLSQIEEIEKRSYAPVETLILEDCKHSPHVDQHDAVLSGIAEFVARLERIEAADVKVA